MFAILVSEIISIILESRNDRHPASDAWIVGRDRMTLRTSSIWLTRADAMRVVVVGRDSEVVSYETREEGDDQFIEFDKKTTDADGCYELVHINLSKRPESIFDRSVLVFGIDELCTHFALSAIYGASKTGDNARTFDRVQSKIDGALNRDRR